MHCYWINNNAHIWAWINQAELLHLTKKNVLSHQDSAPAQKGAIAMEKLHELLYQLLRHPPYSLDLDHSDSILFPKMKK